MNDLPRPRRWETKARPDGWSRALAAEGVDTILTLFGGHVMCDRELRP